MAENKSKTLKYLSLITLTLQNAVLGLSMRYSRTRSGDLFLSSTGKWSMFYSTEQNKYLLIGLCHDSLFSRPHL